MSKYEIGSEKQIYASAADEYDALVSREDADRNVIRTLEEIVPLAGLDVVEFGAGTGRISVQLAPRVGSLRAYDLADPMLDVARARLSKLGVANWTLENAPHHDVPAEDRSADLVVSGWSLCYAVVDHLDGDWRGELSRVLAEVERVLRPGGTVVLFENGGAGSDAPEPPTHLNRYYEELRRRGFEERTIRTDFEFDSVDHAESLIRPFFGDELADLVVENGWRRVPETTLVYWKKAIRSSD